MITANHPIWEINITDSRRESVDSLIDTLTTKGCRYAMLSMGDTVAFTPYARTQLNQLCNTLAGCVFALHIPNSVLRGAVQLYLKDSAPSITYSIWSDRVDAITWLLTQQR